MLSFGADVVTLAHTRKFARRARDYERAYRRGHKGLLVEDVVKVSKTYRSAFDSDREFCAANIVVCIGVVCNIVFLLHVSCISQILCLYQTAWS